MKRFWITASAVLLGCVFGGCYHIGSLTHPQIQSLAVAPVVNETTIYNASAMVRQAVCEQFMVDGSLKLKDLEQADCQLFIRITSVIFTQKSDSSFNTINSDRVYVPREWTATIRAGYTVVIPGRREPLCKGTATGTANFQVQADPEINRISGIRQAAREMAVQIMYQITEAW